MRIEFTCPLCREIQHIEEIMTGVTVSTVVNEIHGCGDAEYGLSSNDGGGIDRFQCLKCGYTIRTVDGAGRESNIINHQQLFLWLKENGFLK